MTVKTNDSGSLTCWNNTKTKSEEILTKSGSLPKNWGKRFEEIKALWNGTKGSLSKKNLSGSQSFFLNLQERTKTQVFRASQELFNSQERQVPSEKMKEVPEIESTSSNPKAHKKNSSKDIQRPLESFPHIKRLLPEDRTFSTHMSDLYVLLTQTNESGLVRKGDYVIKEEPTGLEWKKKDSRAKTFFRKVAFKTSDKKASEKTMTNIINLLCEAAKKGVVSFEIEVDSDLTSKGDEIALTHIMEKLLENKYCQKFLNSSPDYRDLVFKFFLKTLQDGVTQNVKSMHSLFESGCIDESCNTLVKAISGFQKDKMVEIEETYLDGKSVEDLSEEDLGEIFEKLGTSGLGLPEDQRRYVLKLLENPGEVCFDNGRSLWEFPEYFKWVNDTFQPYLHLTSGFSQKSYEDLPENIADPIEPTPMMIDRLVHRSAQVLIQQELKGNIKRKVDSVSNHINNLTNLYENYEFGDLLRELFHLANNGVNNAKESFPTSLKALVRRSTNLLIQNQTQLSDGSTFSVDMQNVYMQKIQRYTAASPMRGEKIEKLMKELAEMVSPNKGKEKDNQKALVKTASEGMVALRSWKKLYDRSQSLRSRSIYSRL